MYESGPWNETWVMQVLVFYAQVTFNTAIEWRDIHLLLDCKGRFGSMSIKHWYQSVMVDFLVTTAVQNIWKIVFEDTLESYICKRFSLFEYVIFFFTQNFKTIPCYQKKKKSQIILRAVSKYRSQKNLF